MTSALPHAVPRARILVVEDLPSQRETLCRMLERFGFGVAAVHDGALALAMLRKSRVDLVCMDVGLPRESGYQICEIIRNDPAMSDVAVLLMDDRASPLDRARAYEAGALGYLVKPFTVEELEEEVDSVLYGPRSSGRVPANEGAR